MALFFYLLALACWLGTLLFFSLLAAPVIFSQLAPPEAGRVISGIFAQYYRVGYVAQAIAMALAVRLAMVRSGRAYWIIAAAVLGIGLAITLYAGLSVRPRVQAVRAVVEEANPDPLRRQEFDSLHRLSVQLNGAVMLLNLLALIATAAALGHDG